MHAVYWIYVYALYVEDHSSILVGAYAYSIIAVEYRDAPENILGATGKNTVPPNI